VVEVYGGRKGSFRGLGQVAGPKSEKYECAPGTRIRSGRTSFCLVVKSGIFKIK
jgi:hypothetical protein